MLGRRDIERLGGTDNSTAAIERGADGAAVTDQTDAVASGDGKRCGTSDNSSPSGLSADQFPQESKGYAQG